MLEVSLAFIIIVALLAFTIGILTGVAVSRPIIR